MTDTLKELLQSKKAIATICGILVVVLSPVVGWFGYEVDNAKLQEIVVFVATYVVGQGIADHGSTAASIKAAGPADPSVVVGQMSVTNDQNATMPAAKS